MQYQSDFKACWVDVFHLVHGPLPGLAYASVKPDVIGILPLCHMVISCDEGLFWIAYLPYLFAVGFIGVAGYGLDAAIHHKGKLRKLLIPDPITTSAPMARLGYT